MFKTVEIVVFEILIIFMKCKNNTDKNNIFSEIENFIF